MGLREGLWAVVVLLLIPFIVNQLSNRLDFSWSIWAAVIACLIALVLVITSEAFTQRIWADLGRRHRAATIVVGGLIAGLLGAGATSLLVWRLGQPQDTSGPIKWELAGPFTMGTYRGESILRFSGFMIHGTNITDKPIARISGYIRSNITNEKLPIYLTADGKRVPPERTHGIPPRARVEVSAPFGPASFDDVTQMLDEAALWKRFGDFTFVVELDGRHEEHRLSPDDIARIITKWKQRTYGADGPHIKEKSQ